MNQSGPTTGKYALTFGLILGAAGVVFSLIQYSMGLLYEKNSAQSIIGILMAVVIIAIGIYNFKKENQGFLEVKEAIKIGTGAGVIAALVSILYLLVLANVIEPDFWEKSLELGKTAMIEANPSLTDEQLDQALEMQKKFLWITYPAMIIMNTLLGLVIGVLTGIVLKKKAVE